ncbi:MAG: 2-hydroxychromene-2-carboxylate isomerase [Pseudomonadota bacterium]
MITIDYIYSAHSAYAYLGAPELMRIAKAHGARIRHVPIALSPVVEAAGGLSFAGRTQAHVDYFFGRELERWAEYRGLPILSHRPTHHDAPYDLANGVIVAAQEAGMDVDAVSLAILQAHWRDDADLSDAGVLAVLLGGDAGRLLEAAEGEAVQAVLAQNTQAAIADSVFGSPTYVVGGDAFYGQDHLPLVERALGQPFRSAGFVNPPVDG